MPNPQSDYKRNGKLVAASPPREGSILEITGIPRDLAERRIYGLLDTKTSGPGIVVIDAVIQALLNDSIVAEFPFGIADFTDSASIVQDQSSEVSSLFNAGGTPVGDSLNIVVPKQLDAALAQITLQPFRVNLIADKLKVVFNKVRDDSGVLQGFYVFVGVNSTRF